MGTINGLPIKEVLLKLKEPCTYAGAVRTDHGNNPYIIIEAFRTRMNEVLGIEHFHEEYRDFQLVSLPNASEGFSHVFVVQCTITILDDDGNIVVKKTGGSGDEPMPVNNTGKFSQLNNTVESSYAAAFKSCCKRFDIFSLATNTKKVEKKQKAGKEEKKEESKTIEFISNEPITLLPDSNPTHPSFHTNVYIRTGGKMSCKTSELIFWYKEVNTVKEKFEQLVATSEHLEEGKHYKIICVVKEHVYKGVLQYHFVRFS